MDDFSNNSLDVSVTLRIVQSTELRNSLAQVSVSHENGSLGSLTLTKKGNEQLLRHKSQREGMGKEREENKRIVPFPLLTIPFDSFPFTHTSNNTTHG